MAENYKTGNLAFDSWQAAFAQGTEAMLGKPGEGPDLAEVTREVEANLKLCHQQAEDWRKTVARQMAPGMEKWLADRAHHPGAAARQWPIDFYKENGTFELGGEVVDLRRLTLSILNAYALQDHIIPPPCAKALGPLVGTKDYTELPLPGGHVGVYVSSKSQGIVGKTVFDWPIERQ